VSFGGSTDVLDILLKLSNLQGFVAGTQEAAGGIREIGVAARETSAQTVTAGNKMSGLAGLASKAYKASAVAAGAFAYESVKKFNNFQAQMAMIHTQAGASAAEVKIMTQAILGMSASGMYAQGPEELAMGLYHLESIGLRGKRALDALKISAQGAAVGHADLEQTASALGAAWLVQIKGAGNLNQVMATLNATVGAGNIRMNQLVDSLGTGVLAAAKNAGVSLQDTMGALATLTDEGYQGSSAMAQLATAFHFLTDPTTKAKKALASIGLEQFELANTMRTKGLPAALRELQDHLSRFSPTRREAVLGDILPAGRGRVLAVLMNQVDRYAKKVQQIDHTSKQFGQDIIATHKTAAFQLHAAWARIEADMVRVGKVLSPIAVALAKALASVVHSLILATPAIIKLLPYVTPLAAAFLAWKIPLIGIAIYDALLPTMAVAWTIAAAAMTGDTLTLAAAWAALTAAMEVNPFVILITVLVAVGVGLYVLYKKCAWFRQAVHVVFDAVKTAVRAAIGGVVAAFHWFMNAVGNTVNFVKHHWRQLILLIGPLGLVIDFVTRHWKWFSNAAKNAWHLVASVTKWAWNTVIHPVFNWLAGAALWVANRVKNHFIRVGESMWKPIKWAWEKVIKPVLNWLVQAFRWAVREIGKAWDRSPIKKLIDLGGKAGGIAGKALSFGKSAGHWLGVLQHGGTVTSPGLSLVGESGPELLSLPRGASVAPLGTGGMGMPAGLTGDMTVVVPVIIDGREVARATGKYVDNRLARQ
jgi:TP901 family phage tail tape measure protein